MCIKDGWISILEDDQRFLSPACAIFVWGLSSLQTSQQKRVCPVSSATLNPAQVPDFFVFAFKNSLP